MVKTVVLHLEEQEYERLISLKGKQSWRDFVFESVENNHQS